jgi:hypothetical protein
MSGCYGNSTPNLLYASFWKGQLDPEGWNAHTNLQLADLLGTSVHEIENRKKRLMRRLAALAARRQLPSANKEKP